MLEHDTHWIMTPHTLEHENTPGDAPGRDRSALVGKPKLPNLLAVTGSSRARWANLSMLDTVFSLATTFAKTD